MLHAEPPAVVDRIQVFPLPLWRPQMFPPVRLSLQLSVFGLGDSSLSYVLPCLMDPRKLVFQSASFLLLRTEWLLQTP